MQSCYSPFTFSTPWTRRSSYEGRMQVASKTAPLYTVSLAFSTIIFMCKAFRIEPLHYFHTALGLISVSNVRRSHHGDLYLKLLA